MKKAVRILAVTLLCIGLSTAAGCDFFGDSSDKNDNNPPQKELPFTPHESAEGIEDRLTLESEKIIRFYEGGSPEFVWADGYSNGNEFNCTWRQSSAKIEDGFMKMSVSREGNGYAGAEYRSTERFSYGFYSVSMKPANCSGIISSFFTYTHQPVWDEIDIEFLGKDMTGVQFNYFTNGVGEHTYYLDLGFDASEDFHEYGFDWQPDSITWYVDGTAVYKATETLPSHPMQIMMNVWNPRGLDGWCGPLDKSSLPATAEYEWIAYSPN